VQYAVAGNGDVDFFGPQFSFGADVDRAVGKPQQVNFEGFCPGRALPLWFALNATLDALGAPRDLNFLNLDNGHGFNYTSRQTQVTYIYGKALSQGLRVLVYEGDSDPCGLQTAPVEDVFVPYFASIGLSKTSDWRPWTTDGEQEMGGYVIEWEKGQARFVSIRGSGHLVPMNRPHVSSTMLKTWLAGDPFPVYKPPSPSRQQQQQRQSQRRYRRQSSVPLAGH